MKDISNMTSTDDNDLTHVTTYDEDGNEVNLAIIEVVTVDDKDYALLVREEDIEKEDAEIVLMHFSKEGEEYLFELIEDDDEFELVSQAILDDIKDDNEK